MAAGCSFESVGRRQSSEVVGHGSDHEIVDGDLTLRGDRVEFVSERGW